MACLSVVPTSIKEINGMQDHREATQRWTEKDVRVELNDMMRKGKSREGAYRMIKHRCHPDKGGEEDMFKMVCRMEEAETKRTGNGRRIIEEEETPVCLGLIGGVMRVALTSEMDFRPIDCLCNTENSQDAPAFKGFKIKDPSSLRVERRGDKVTFHAGNESLDTNWFNQDGDIKGVVLMKQRGLKIVSFDPKMPITKRILDEYKIFPREMIDLPIAVSKMKEEFSKRGADACVPKKSELEKIKSPEDCTDIVMVRGCYLGKEGGGSQHTVEIASSHEYERYMPVGSRHFISKHTLTAIEYLRVNSLLNLANLPTIKTHIEAAQDKKKANASKKVTGTKRPADGGNPLVVLAPKKKQKKRVAKPAPSRYAFEAVAPPNGKGGYALNSEDMSEYNTSLRSMLMSGRFVLTEFQKDAVFDMRMRSGSDWGCGDTNRTLVHDEEYDIIVYRETRESDPFYKIAPRSVISHRIPNSGTPNPQFYRRVRVAYKGNIVA